MILHPLESVFLLPLTALPHAACYKAVVQTYSDATGIWGGSPARLAPTTEPRPSTTSHIGRSSARPVPVRPSNRAALLYVADHSGSRRPHTHVLCAKSVTMKAVQ